MSYEFAQRVGGAGTVADGFDFYQERRFEADTLHWFFTSNARGFRLSVPAFPSGVDFLPDAGLQRDGVEGTNETQAAEVKVTVAHDNPVAQQFKQQQPEWPIWMKLYRVQLATGRAVLSYRGQVVNGEFSDEICQLTVTSLKSLFQKSVPLKTYQPTCNNQLYDQFCAVNESEFSLFATIDDIADRVLTVTWTSSAGSTTIPPVEGFFTGGKISHPSVNDTGGFEMVASHHELGVGQATLNMLQRNSWLAVGDTVLVAAGCDRTLAICRNRFNNPQHFIAFPRIPAVNPYTDGVV